MGSTDAKSNLAEKLLAERTPPIHLGGSCLGVRPHVCAFFNHPDDEYRVLLPFVKEGFERGEKAVHTINPRRHDDHVRRLAAAGIDVTTARRTGQFDLRGWADAHLRDGQFDQQRTLALFEEVAKNSKQQGFKLIRFITHMEWVFENKTSIDDLLEYEARANFFWLDQDGPLNPVICTYDLTKFSGEVVVDIMRTHPMIIIGGILQENPFFVPPEEFLQELSERRSSRTKQ